MRIVRTGGLGASSGVACPVSQSPDRNVSKISDILFSRYAAGHRSLLSCDGANRAMYALTTYGEFKGVLHEIFFKKFFLLPISHLRTEMFPSIICDYPGSHIMEQKREPCVTAKFSETISYNNLVSGYPKSLIFNSIRLYCDYSICSSTIRSHWTMKRSSTT